MPTNKMLLGIRTLGSRFEGRYGKKLDSEIVITGERYTNSDEYGICGRGENVLLGLLA